MNDDSKQLAKAILQDQGMRRKVMLVFLIALVAFVALGTWFLDSWLGESLVLFSIYWGGVMLGVVFLMLFCLYDMLQGLRQSD